MPDDVGGQPFPDGEEPEYRYGAADEEFAALVLDEEFVRSAVIHEPTAVERILAAAQSHAESETVRGFEDGYVYGPGTEGEFVLDEDDPDGTGDPDGLSGEDDLDDPDDDEGRFDRSDYTQYLDPADADEYDHYGPHEPYGPYGPYGPYSYNPNSFGDSGHYAPYQYGRFTGPDQNDQYGQYIRFGINRRYDPRFDLGEEHGSDYRRPGRRGKHSAAPRRRRPYRDHMRWQRPVAWLLALMMGIGMVALALGAVRGASQQRQDPSPPPATTGVDSSGKGSDGAQRTPETPAAPKPG